MLTALVWFVFYHLFGFGLIFGVSTVLHGMKIVRDVNRRDNEEYYSSFTTDARTYLRSQMPKFRAFGYINILVGLMLSIGFSILFLILVGDIVSIQ